MSKLLSSLLQRLAVISVGFGGISVPPSILQLPDDIIEDSFEDAADNLRDRRQRLALVRLMAQVPSPGVQTEVAQRLTAILQSATGLERLLIFDAIASAGEPSERLLLCRVLPACSDMVGARTTLDVLRGDPVDEVRHAAEAIRFG